MWFELSDVIPSELPLVGLLLAAAALDFGLGDPWNWPHPVQFMGQAITAYNRLFLTAEPGQHRGAQADTRPPASAQLAPESPCLVPRFAPGLMKLAGVGLGLGLIGGSFTLTWAGLLAMGQISPLLRWWAEVILLASCFAGRSLRRAAEDVLVPLTADDLEGARTQLSQYVGRDTHSLTAPDIYRAILETVSENAIDGVLAPLFYAILGALIGAAAPMAIAYKAASTLDSMVGYRRSPYTDLGWFSARLEDRLTWLPCRLSVLVIALLSGQPRQVLQRCWQDARLDPSPNSGWSECAYAAALGVQLGGINYYKGEKKLKPLLGEAKKPITANSIQSALKMTRWSFLCGLTVGCFGLGVRYLLAQG